MDDNVCFGLIRKCFSFDAWDVLEAAMDTTSRKLDLLALCVTEYCIPWRAFAVMVALFGSICEVHGTRIPESKLWFCRARFSM